MWLPSWCSTSLTYCSISEVKFVCTEEEGACVLTRNLSLSLKPCAGSRVCAGCTVCRHSPFHKSCAWFTGSAGRLASPHPIPFLQLLLLCFVRPLSLPSNPPPLPALKSAAAVRGPACAGYEIGRRRPLSSCGQASGSVPRCSHTQQHHWMWSAVLLVISGRVAAKIVAVYIQPFSARPKMGQM